MAMVDPVPTTGDKRQLATGMILVNGLGNLRVLRSRTKADDGWNCADGAAIDDADAYDTRKWMAYEPERLAADLRLAAELHGISGERELQGGLATWDACSGRPCALPRLAKLVR